MTTIHHPVCFFGVKMNSGKEQGRALGLSSVADLSGLAEQQVPSLVPETTLRPLNKVKIYADENDVKFRREVNCARRGELGFVRDLG